MNAYYIICAWRERHGRGVKRSAKYIVNAENAEQALAAAKRTEIPRLNDSRCDWSWTCHALQGVEAICVCR